MKKVLIFAMLAAATALFFSCSSDPESRDEFLDRLQNYCVYPASEQCFKGSYTTCPGGGELSNTCPYSSLPGDSPSSNSAGSASSSSGVGGGGLPNFNFCVFIADNTCLSGPVSECPPGGQLSNACPYISSSSGISSSGGGGNPACPLSPLSNVFTDPRDCKTYRYENGPNGKIWMSENLNFSRNNTLGYCYGVDIDGADPHQDASGCANGYGRVYEYATAIDGNSPQGLCPPGWHIPSIAEWSSVIGNGTTARIMSLDFYIYPGNYNVNGLYPPIGWKERGQSGFYWTSSGNTYFTGFWEGDRGISYPPVLEAGSGASDTDRFSVRCIADGSSPITSSSSSSVSLPSSSSIPSTSSSSKPSSSSVSPSSSSSGSSSSRSSSSVASSSSIGSSGGVVYGISVPYGGETYQTVVIGTQTWFARNLNYDPGTGTSACYDNKSSNCDFYGRLYDWNTAMTVCPSGWHLPSRAEWNVLGDDAKKLKATSGWANPDWVSGNGTDDYGFSALPGGFGRSDGSFRDFGYYGNWWSANEYFSYNAYYRHMYYDVNIADWSNFDEAYLLSVRCLQD